MQANGLPSLGLAGVILVSAFAALFILHPKDEITLTTGADDFGIVSVTVDGGVKSQYDHLLILSRVYGIRGTLFINTGSVSAADDEEEDRYAMNWAEVRAFYDEGWEIGSQGSIVADLTQLDDDAIAAELERASGEIERQIGVAPVSFAAPYGEYDARVLEQVARRYDYHARVFGSHFGRNDLATLNRMEIDRIAIDDGVSPSAVCGEIVEAAQNREWMVLMFQEIVTTGAGQYQSSESNIEHIFSCIHYLRVHGEIKVVPIREAIQTAAGKNQ